MKREIKSREVRRRIIDATNDLIWDKGYQQTTIREIIKKAGVNTGSLYHYFRDKEEILLVLAAKTYNNTIEVAQKMTEGEKDNILTFALIRALEYRMWYKYRNAAAIGLDMYASWRITKRVLPVDIERHKLCFQKYNRTFTDQDYYSTTLAGRGMRLSLLTECFYEGPANFKKRWPFLIAAELHLFNVPERVIEEIIQKVKNLIGKKSITIRGLKL